MVTDLIFVMGPTNVGKGYTIRYAVKKYGAYSVSVGDLLRAKYGPNFFNGQQAPEHCRAEALKMMVEGIQAGIDSGSQLVLIDGQPREPAQVQVILDNYLTKEMDGKVDVHFLLLHCDDDIRMKRVLARDKDPAALELSQKRFVRDGEELNKILYQILLVGEGGRIIPLDTGTENEKEFDDFLRMLNYDHFKTIEGS